MMYILYNACEDIAILKVVMIIMNVFKMICIIAPIILILLLCVDFGKNVIAGNEDEMKENLNKAIKRVIACIFIFLVPSLVSLVVNILGDLGVNYTECITNANKEYISMLAQQKKNNQSQSSTDPNKTYPAGTGQEGRGTSQTTKSDTEKEQKEEVTKDEEFYLDKNMIILCHYHGNKVSKTKIKIYNKDGKKLSNKKFSFKLGKPLAEITEKGKIEAIYAGRTKVTVISKANPNNKKKFTLVILKDIYTKGYLNRKVKTYDLKTGEKVTLPKGLSGTLNGGGMDLPSSSNTNLYYHGDILKVGSSYYPIDYNSYTPTSYAVSKAYSKEVAEEFVNSYGFTSNTKHLFWVNQGTEYNYHFVRKKKKWVLKDIFEVNTGDVFGLNAKYNGGNCDGSVSNSTYSSGLGDCNSFSDKNIDVRRLDGYWKGQWLVQKYVIFNHKDNGGGWLGAWHEGYTAPREPKSHGCVRHRTAVMIWIRDHINEVAGSRLVYF